MAALVTASLALALASGPDGVEQPWLAVEYDIAPGWHIYWENPGDSGMPTSAEVTLPDGWTTPGPLFPGPDRSTAPGDIAVLGYEHHAALLFPLAAATPRTAGPAHVTTRWLACRADRCIPGEAELSLALDADIPPPTATARQALDRLPRNVPAPRAPTVGDWVVDVGPGQVVDVFATEGMDGRVARWRETQSPTGTQVVVTLGTPAVSHAPGDEGRLVVKVAGPDGIRFISASPIGPVALDSAD